MSTEYTKPRTVLSSLIPAVLQSELNTSLTSNTFDRFLTKEETTYVGGSVGIKHRSPKSIRIPEKTAHAAAWQLQPVIYQKKATVENVTAFYDILRKLQFEGIDTSRLATWGATEEFNFAPPITPDKIINYSDYYWIGDSVPQYITIRNYGTILQARIETLQSKIDNLVDHPGSEAEVIATNQLINGLELEKADFENSLAYDENNILGDEWVWDSTHTWKVVNIPVPTGVIPGFDPVIRTTNSQNQWIVQNKWVHKNNIPLGHKATQAVLPIIEYDDSIDLNEWTYTKHKWAYRSTAISAWQETDVGPTLNELRNRMPIMDVEYAADPNHCIFTILGNYEPLFVPGFNFCVELSTVLASNWQTVSSSYDSINDVTLIEVTQAPVLDADGCSTYGVPDFDEKSYDGGPDCGVIVPYTETSKGDAWLGFFEHWLWLGADTPMPINRQLENPYVRMYQTIATQDQTEFMLPDGVNFEYGTSNTRVYVNGIRQYFEYQENRPTYGRISSGITFFDGLNAGDVVRVETSPAAASDIGKERILVRTVGSGETVTDYAEYVCLIEYRKNEQNKSAVNQYPIFDLFYYDSTSAHAANSLFVYAEDVNALANDQTSMRLAVTENGKNYHFNQLFVSAANELYFYHRFDIDEYQTLWKKGSLDQYVPRYVNEYREASGDTYTDENGVIQTVQLQVGDPAGDWEIVNPFYFNLMHEHRTNVSFRELYSHYSTIIQRQQVPNFSHVYPGIVKDTDYGVGGTIKIHNDNMDLLTSCTLQDVVTVTDLLDWANNQYKRQLAVIDAIFSDNIKDLVRDSSYSALDDLATTAVTNIIRMFEQTSDKVFFGDSTMYDGTHGIKNWIPTLPMLGLSHLVAPRLYETNLIHHDGHTSPLVIDRESHDIMFKHLQIDVTAPTEPSNVTSGMLWFDVSSQTLYKMNAVVSGNSPVEPSSGEIFWLNSSTNQVFRSQSGVWVATILTAHDLWVEIDLHQLRREIFLRIEQKLYDVVQVNGSARRFGSHDMFFLSGADETLFYTKLEERFLLFCQNNNLTQPFESKYVASDPFTWNFKNVIQYASENVGNSENLNINWPVTDVTSDLMLQTAWSTSAVYEVLYGTPIPHVEPWVLQGFDAEPSWWSSEYGVYGNWSQNMWDNIKAGIVPASVPHTIPTYAALIGINTTGITVDGYEPGDLLPLYVGGDLQIQNQCLIPASFHNAPIVLALARDDAYVFGAGGPHENEWKDSVDYNYDIQQCLYAMQPMKYLCRAFDELLVDVNGLQISPITKNVRASLRDVIFHGSMNASEVKISNGLNQWFAMYHRMYGFDMEPAGIQQDWNEWTVKLAYVVDSVVDTESIQAKTDHFPIATQDYAATIKRTKGIERKELTSFMIQTVAKGTSVAKGSAIVPAGNGDDWTFEISGVGPITSVSVLAPKSYHVTSFDVISGTMVLDQNHDFDAGTEIRIVYSGDYMCKNIVRDMPLYVITTEYPNVIKLADSYTTAIEQLALPIFDQIQAIQDIQLSEFDDGDFVVGNLEGTGTHFFQYDSAQEKWVRYSNSVEILRLPAGSKHVLVDAQGIQMVENVDYRNISDEWIEILRPVFMCNGMKVWLYPDYTSSNVFEQQKSFFALGGTNTNVVWRQHAYTQDAETVTLPVRVKGVQNVLDFVYGYVAFKEREGFVFNKYVPPEADTETGGIVSWDNELEKAIDTIYSSGLVNTPRMINPFKHNLYVTTSGIVANIFTGPYAKQTPCVYDQFGQAFVTSRNIKVFRNNDETHIACPPPLDASVGAIMAEPFISAARFYVDHYQHALVFNQYTMDGFLVYDPFVGVNINKVRLLFNKQPAGNFRPNLGGYYMNNNRLLQNIESSVSNIAQYYDTNTVSETADYLSYARHLLGYKDPAFLNGLDVNGKSKFLFWKGMIQAKGSSNSVNPFINSKRFKSASMDEFYAYEIASYGHSKTPSYPRLNLVIGDTTREVAKFDFANLSEPYDSTADFSQIYATSTARWFGGSNRTFAPDNFSFRERVVGVVNIDAVPVSGFANIAVVGDRVELYAYNSLTDIATTVTPQSSEFEMDPPFIAGSESVFVTKDGFSVSVYEHLDGAMIYFPEEVVGSEVTIIRKRAKLAEHVHYELLANNVIKFLDPVKLAGYSVQAFSFAPNYQVHNPLKLIDRQSGTTVFDVPAFDPLMQRPNARIQQYVTYAQQNDPAMYNTDTTLPVDAALWGTSEVKRTWLRTDDRLFGYIPYHNTKSLTERDRVAYWGNLASWSTIEFYEWTETTTAPIDLIKQHELEQTTEFPLASYQYRTRDDINSTEWSDWIDMHPKHYVRFGYDQTNMFDVSALNINMADTTTYFAVYVNEIALPLTKYRYDLVSGTDSVLSTIILETDIIESDVFRVVKFFESPSTDLIAQTQETPELIQYSVITPYTIYSVLDSHGNVNYDKYCYWIRGKNTVTDSRDITMLALENEIRYPSAPFYAIMENTGSGYKKFFVKNIKHAVNENDRYDMQLTVDETCRDIVDANRNNLLPIHREWSMFREHQNYNIPRTLWNKVIETMIGYSLEDNTQLVPSLDRVLTDAKQGTTTQFGIGATQCLGNKNNVINIVVRELNNSSVSWQAVNREEFFASYSFDTPDHIVAAMNRIYTTFPKEHVNRIFFSVLKDTLASVRELEGIYKTSYVALYGIHVIETAGLVVDD